MSNLYYSLKYKDGKTRKLIVTKYEETEIAHIFHLQDLSVEEIQKSELKSAICTGFEPFWADVPEL